MGYLSGWSYYKVISLTGQTGAGTLYQVELDIGASAGGDFHLENHCTNFPQDIEVTDNDGTTLLDFWIEDITADPLKMWVEVADDLGSNQSIWVYYGKSGATTNSNGANTFLQYHGAATADFIDSLTISHTAASVWEGKVKATSATHNIFWGLSNSVVSDSDWSRVQSYSAGNLRYHVEQKSAGVYTTKSEAPSLTVNTYYKGKIVFDGTTKKGYFDDNEIGSGGISTNLPDTTLGLAMRAYIGTSAQDWSFVRKYNSPEPAFSSAGAEQSVPTGGHPTMRRWGGIPGMRLTGRNSW